MWETKNALLVAGNDKKLIDVTKKWLSSNFEMKDMREASYVLGVKILRDLLECFLGLSQETYIKKMFMDTPVERNLSLSLDMCPKLLEEKEKMSKVPYSSAIGSLMYAMICTRLDICYALRIANGFQYNPGIKHWMVVKRILRYLKGTTDYVLCYQRRDL